MYCMNITLIWRRHSASMTYIRYNCPKRTQRQKYGSNLSLGFDPSSCSFWISVLVYQKQQICCSQPKQRCWRPRTCESSDSHFRIVISLGKSFSDTPTTPFFLRNRGVQCPLKSLLWVEPVLWPILARRWHQDRGPASCQWGQWVLFQCQNGQKRQKKKFGATLASAITTNDCFILASLASLTLKPSNNLFTWQNYDIKCG